MKIPIPVQDRDPILDPAITIPLRTVPTTVTIIPTLLDPMLLEVATGPTILIIISGTMKFLPAQIKEIANTLHTLEETVLWMNDTIAVHEYRLSELESMMNYDNP
ncbi:hypothetical protein RhiirA5_447908, partial [Rhizophagus irregularis]